MSTETRDADSFYDIYEAIQRIVDYTSGQSKPAFFDDIRTQDAVIRNLEVVGEATKNLSLSFREKYSQFPWREMPGLRDRLIHHYFGVNYEIVWQIVQQELPELEAKAEKVLPDLDN